MKKKLFKILVIFFVSFMLFSNFNVQALYKEDFNQNQNEIKHRNELIEHSNKYLKIISSNAKLLQNEYNLLGKKINENKDLKNTDKQNLITELNTIYKNEISKYNLASEQVKKIDKVSNFDNFSKKEPYLSVLNYKNAFLNVNSKYNELITKKMHNLKTVFLIFSIIVILISIFIILSLLNILIEKIRLKKYKKYLNTIIWDDINEKKRLKIHKSLLFRNIFNTWICEKLEQISKKEVDEKIFSQNLKIIKILEKYDVFNKKTKTELDFFYFEFLINQLIKKDNNFFDYVKENTSNLQYDLSSKKFVQIKLICQRLEKNLEFQNLDIPNLIWYTKKSTENKVNLNPYAMFSFTPKFLKITTEEFEFEISFDKILINKNQQLTFKGTNQKYYINIDQIQKIEIQNYLHRILKTTLSEEK